MNKFIKRILYFVFPLFVIWLGFFIYFEKYVKLDKYEIFRKDLEFKSSPNQFKYLIAGHSRLNRAINTDSLHSAVKVTSPGESCIETYYRLKDVLENTDKEFDILILPFGLGTFKPNDFRRSIYWIQYVDFFEVGYRKKEIGKYTSEWVAAKCLPFLPYYKKEFKSLFSNSSNGIKVDKINGVWSSFDKNEQTQLIQNDIDLLNKIGLVDKTAKHYIEKTISLAEEYNIQIIYINSPLTKDYIQALQNLEFSNGLNYNELNEYVESFSNVKILDMENVFIKQDSLFSDHHHLNITGRDIFTSQLLNQLDSI